MNTSSAFHKVVWWHISGEVDKFTIFWCNVSSVLCIPKIIDRVILENKKVAVSWDTVYIAYDFAG